MSRPLNIAHRGGTGLWPENTLEAFECAIHLGVDGIELDVHLSRDGQLVVHHDESLNTAIARGPDDAWLEEPTPLIKDLTIAELRTYDVGRLRPGSEYAARHPEQSAIDGARIPLLKDVYGLVQDRTRPGFRLYVELKTLLDDPSAAPDPPTLAEAAVALTHRMEMIESVILVSADWRTLVQARAIAPKISIAFTTPSFALIDPTDPSASDEEPYSRRALIRQLSATGAPWFAGFDWRDQPGETFAERVFGALSTSPTDGWFAWHGDVAPETAALARERHLEISCWTVDDPVEMSRLATLGVDAILTDRPDRLATALEQPDESPASARRPDQAPGARNQRAGCASHRDRAD
ncbi:glycerophosphodiester phosphodiesterase [soil metagenome]